MAQHQRYGDDVNLIQADSMLKLQSDMNAKVNPAWLYAGYAWMRAAMVEGVEAIGHHGWKWWKKEEPNIDQLRIELVDIWHFYLSSVIAQFGGNMATAAGVIVHETTAEFTGSGLTFDGCFYEFKKLTLLKKLDLLVGLAAVERLSIPLFMSICDDVDLSPEYLYRLYVSKNVLNFFRQDKGYKSGTYIKMWDGREDNEWLAELADALDPNAVNFQADLYSALEMKYLQVLTAGSVQVVQS